MKIALVYDRVNKWGGAERVLLALHRIWPDAPLFTAVYDSKRASWARVFHINSSFMQYLPLAKSHHELYPWLTPLAFESFSFDGYDVVLSVTSAEAKDIITKPGTVHICYCLTPTRYLWSGYNQYLDYPGLGGLSTIAARSLGALSPLLRRWDLTASARPDYYIAISERVAGRIRTYYHRDPEAVIYPPVRVGMFRSTTTSKDRYFLTVSRFVGYKRTDIVIDAFNALGWPLVVIGEGWHGRRLRQLARSNIRFVGSHLTDSELVRYYRNCRAFVYAGDEDFGIAAVEAQASGKPVIAYRESGVSEIVRKDTGIVFREQSKESLISALRTFDDKAFNRAACRKNAMRFDSLRFADEMKNTVIKLYQKGRRI